MKNPLLYSSLMVAWGLLAMAGCGSSDFSPAEGVVTLDGQPLADATVVFQAPSMPMSTARTDEDGWYLVETGGRGGIKPGEYLVTIAAYKMKGGKRTPKLAIPRKYLQPKSSGFKVVINQGSNRNLDFELTSN